MRILILGFGLLCVVGIVYTQSPCDGGSCYPDIGDLLVGREDNLTATSTCGLNGPEQYCIVSHLKDNEKCFICDANAPDENHDVANVITTFNNRLETWWQSENGLNEVSLRLNLETSFHFTHLIMTFKTFRPAAMLIERSNDYGKTWHIYRYFAVDCDEFWPGIPMWPPREIDQVICDNRYSLIEPSTEGEVIYKVLEPSLIPNEDAYSDKIQNLLTITNLRINFTAMHTLGDDLLDHRENIKEKYYYSLYELIVRGNCFCYGHADECRPIYPSLERPDLIRRRILQRKNNGAPIQPKVNGKCQCEHNTEGLNCERCLPFYHDLPWRPARRGQPNECKLCNCNNHATSCHFDQAVYEASGQVSGGVCENCAHNTAGQHCELCLPGFYPHPDRAITDPRRCEPCNCEVAGSLNNGLCLQESDPSSGITVGDCVCKDFVTGRRCDQCKDGFYNLDINNRYGCTLCDCDDLGTLSGSNSCDSQTGQCICKRHTTGRRCDQCLAETWGMSADGDGCRECFCDVGGSYDNDCNQLTGQCNCRPNINLRRCNDSVSGFFQPDLDYYVFEAEDATGERTFLYKQKYDPNAMWTGYGFKMVRPGGTLVFIVEGLPASMEYDFILRYSPYTTETTENIGVRIERPFPIAIGSVCDNTKPSDDNWVSHLRGYPTSNENLGTHCMESEQTYKVILTFPDKMDDVNVDSLVLVPKYSGISMFHGSVEGEQRSHEFEELDCQEEALILPPVEQNEICGGLVFSMSAIIHDGSLPCDCDRRGSLSSICEKMGGQCICKKNVMGRRCDKCVPGTYGLGPEGCRPCDCDAQGALQPDFQYCDPTGGQCRCKHPGITGRKCDKCKAGFYKFPDCLPCQCNGHSDYCDQDTGVCLNCREHTTGEHCEICEDGYYGNPLLGSGDQCKACMCPGGPESGRQFAATCQEVVDGLTFQRKVKCNCLPGYTGETCDQCAPGNYGNPHEIGGYCIACECNGNIDVNDPFACDARTGVCTGCLYNTAGPNCERCRDFYYGNAFTKDCRACQCDVRGTEPSSCVGGQCQCDEGNGQCPCLPNMSGRQCESCLPNFYRGAEGEGCRSCNCNPSNSFSATCDEFTGQCQCRDGFGGLTCDDCASGYWGNPPVDCRECNCDPLGSKSPQCDPRTGDCVCHDGVGGKLCDRCHRGFTGQVPYCEPCGECFDDWDLIISELENRTNAAIAKAREIQNTGVSGAYEKEFEEIEIMLDDLRSRLGPQGDEPGIQDLIDQIKQRIETQEQRLKDLETEMNRIQADDTQANDALDDIESTLNDVQAQFDELNDRKNNVTKASPAAAYKRVEAATEKSAEAEKQARAATTEPGSLTEQSKNIREEIESVFEEKLVEFSDKLEQAQMEVDDSAVEVDKLSVAELNGDVCGVATDGCDDTCGGALCDQGCGGLGCNGAVTNANVAKDRALKTDEILTQLDEDAVDFLNKIQAAKDNAQNAKDAAERAKKQADEVEQRIRERNAKIRDLIGRIRKFLEEDRATPEQIEELANTVLGLELKAKRQEIDDLAASIRDLVDRLPDVDRILNETQADLDRANALKAAADQAKADAASVAGDAQAVKDALDSARTASDLAEDAKNSAVENINTAQEKINEISKSASAVLTKVSDMQDSLNDLDSELKSVEEKMAANKLEAQNALDEANVAKETATIAKEALTNNADLINQANATINAKKAQVDRLQKLRQSAEDLSKFVSDNLDRLNELSDEFNANEVALEARNDELNDLLRQANELYQSIEEKERNMRVCP